jgi:hypothetical protein
LLSERERIPPQEAGQARNLPYPQVINPATPPLRPQRNVPNSIASADGTHSASILLLGNYSLASFDLGAESGGGIGTVVTDPSVSNSSVITPPHG